MARAVALPELEDRHRQRAIERRVQCHGDDHDASPTRRSRARPETQRPFCVSVGSDCDRAATSGDRATILAPSRTTSVPSGCPARTGSAATAGATTRSTSERGRRRRLDDRARRDEPRAARAPNPPRRSRTSGPGRRPSTAGSSPGRTGAAPRGRDPVAPQTASRARRRSLRRRTLGRRRPATSRPTPCDPSFPRRSRPPRRSGCRSTRRRARRRAWRAAAPAYRRMIGHPKGGPQKGRRVRGARDVARLVEPVRVAVPRVARGPSACAVAFMSVTNAGTLPPARTASVVAASFALGTSVPITRSRTETRCPARRSSDDSPTRAATVGTLTVPSSGSRSRATSAVMSFVMLAIARGVSAPRAASVRPSTVLCTT